MAVIVIGAYITAWSAAQKDKKNKM